MSRAARASARASTRANASAGDPFEENFLPDFYDAEKISWRILRSRARAAEAIEYAKATELLKDSRTNRAAEACLRVHSAFYQSARFFAEDAPDEQSDWVRDCVCGMCVESIREKRAFHTVGNRVWFLDTEVKSIERKNVVPFISEIAMVNANATDVFHCFVFYKELHENYDAVAQYVREQSGGSVTIEKSPWDDRARSLPFAEAMYLMLRRVPCLSLIISNGLEHDASAFVENVLYRCSAATANALLSLMQKKQWKWMPMELLRAGLVRGLSRSEHAEEDADFDAVKARIKAFSLKKSLSALVEEEFEPEKILRDADRKYNKAAKALKTVLKSTDKAGDVTLDDVLDLTSDFNTDETYEDVRQSLKNSIAAFVHQARLRTEYFQSNLSPLLVSTLDQLFETHYQYRPPPGWIPFQDPSAFDRPANNPYIAGRQLVGRAPGDSKTLRVLPILRMVHVRYAALSFASPIALNYHTAEVDVLCKLQVVASWFFGFEAVARCASLNPETKRALYEYLLAPTRLDSSVHVQRRMEVFRQRAKVAAANHVKGFAACLLRVSKQASALIYATYYCKVDMLFNTYVTKTLERYKSSDSGWVFRGPFDFPGSLDAKNEVSFVVHWKNANADERARREEQLKRESQVSDSEDVGVGSVYLNEDDDKVEENEPVDYERKYDSPRSSTSVSVSAGAKEPRRSARIQALRNKPPVDPAPDESSGPGAPQESRRSARIAQEDREAVAKLMKEACLERDSTGTTIPVDELAKQGKIPAYQVPALRRKEAALVIQRDGHPVSAGLIQRIRELPPFAQFMPYWIGSFAGRTTVDRDGLFSIKVHHMWCLHFYANALAELLPSSQEERRAFAANVVAARDAIRRGRFPGDVETDFRGVWGAVRTLVEFDNEAYAKRIQSGMRWYPLLDFGSMMSNFVWCKNCKRYAGEKPRPNNVVMQVFAERETGARQKEDASYAVNARPQKDVSLDVTVAALRRIKPLEDAFVFTNPEGYAIEASGTRPDAVQRKTVFKEFVGDEVYRAKVESE